MIKSKEFPGVTPPRGTRWVVVEADKRAVAYNKRGEALAAVVTKPSLVTRSEDPFSFLPSWAKVYRPT